MSKRRDNLLGEFLLTSYSPDIDRVQRKQDSGIHASALEHHVDMYGNDLATTVEWDFNFLYFVLINLLEKVIFINTILSVYIEKNNRSGSRILATAYLKFARRV